MCIRKGVYAREMKRVLWKEFFLFFVKKKYIYISCFFFFNQFFLASHFCHDFFCLVLKIFKIREVQVKERKSLSQYTNINKYS